MNDIFRHAVKLLATRDYSVRELTRRLEVRFGSVPESVIDQLLELNFLDDERFAENFVRSRKAHGKRRLETELALRGIDEELSRDILDRESWPSLSEVVETKMKEMKLSPPINEKSVARLWRSLQRMGYEAEEIQQELERFL